MTTDEELRLIDNKYKIEQILKKLKRKKWDLNDEDDIMIQFTKSYLTKDSFKVFEFFKKDKTCSFCARNIYGMELHMRLPLDELELFVEYLKLRGVIK